MRVAILSDIHGNLTALEAVLDDLEQVAPDLVVTAGDLVVNGSAPAEVLDVVRSRGWPSIQGNTDEMLWRPELLDDLSRRYPERHGLRRMLFEHMAPATADALGPERLEWLRGLPKRWTSDDCAVVHAAPDNLWRAPLADATDQELVDTYGSLGKPVLLYGHIHHGFVRSLPSLIVANCGSVSLSYDGDPRASYAVVSEGHVELRRVAYDIDREVTRLKQSNYPFADWLGTILKTGSYVKPPKE